MTVGSSTVTTINTGRAADAIADAKKYGELMSRHGAKNVRSMLLMSSTPLRMVLSYEAENQAALGEIADKVLADPELQKMMETSFGEGGTSGSYVTEQWIEV
jgi:hypothetical protein